MDHEDRVVRIDQKYHLKEAPAGIRTPDKVPFVVLHQGKRGTSSANNLLSLL